LPHHAALLDYKMHTEAMGMNEHLHNGWWFRAGRNDLRLTQIQASRLFGVSIKTVQKWESPEDNKTSSPLPDRAVRMMAAYLDGHRPSDWPEDSKLKKEKT
jgi:transcriptional regulator with XRE-family HTH domain